MKNADTNEVGHATIVTLIFYNHLFNCSKTVNQNNTQGPYQIKYQCVNIVLCYGKL